MLGVSHIQLLVTQERTLLLDYTEVIVLMKMLPQVLSQQGGKIYDGDLVWFYGKPDDCYKLTSFTINGTQYASGQTYEVSKQFTITGDYTVSTAATQYKCLAPDISGNVYYESSYSSLDEWEARLNIYNPNSFACNYTITRYADGGNEIGGTYTLSVPAKGVKGESFTYTISNGGTNGSSSGGLMVEVYLSATGYTASSTTVKTWNDYTGAEETTTTTTT